jgi:hypothetical protein
LIPGFGYGIKAIESIDRVIERFGIYFSHDSDVEMMVISRRQIRYMREGELTRVTWPIPLYFDQINNTESIGSYFEIISQKQGRYHSESYHEIVVQSR